MLASLPACSLNHEIGRRGIPRDSLGQGNALVSEVAVRSNAILVAVDKDMRQIAKRHGIGSVRFKRLNLLQFRCTAIQSIHRAKEACSLIEHEWGVAETKAARRFWVEVGDSYIRTYR